MSLMGCTKDVRQKKSAIRVRQIWRQTAKGEIPPLAPPAGVLMDFLAWPAPRAGFRPDGEIYAARADSSGEVGRVRRGGTAPEGVAEIAGDAFPEGGAAGGSRLSAGRADGAPGSRRRRRAGEAVEGESGKASAGSKAASAP